MTKNNFDTGQPLLERISDALEDLADHASTILNQGMAEVDWTALDNPAGEAVDAVNFLDQWAPHAQEAVSSLTEALIKFQDKEAWYRMHPADRALIRSALIHLNSISLWTRPRDPETPLCLCREVNE